jgi:hypothetical protein
LNGYFLLLLILSSCASRRELSCSYDRDSIYSGYLWPTYNQCKVSSVDLSESFKTVEHSFSGTWVQKSAVSVVRFDKPTQIDFLPKQMLNDFPHLNGIIIADCDTLSIVKNDLFTEDFGAIQYLSLFGNKIETIEADAFQHLPKLKWIAIYQNQLRSLPHQIFKSNPELIMISFHTNQINSITPDFFKNLSKLQHVEFINSPCTKKIFGCISGSCSVSQSELDSGLSSCHNNCLNDVECASKSGKLDNLSAEQIEKNIDLIVASGHAAILVEKGYSNLLAEKEPTPEPEIVDQKKIGNSKNDSVECDAKKFEEISQDLKDLKRELADLKTTLEAYLEAKLSELFKKEFKAFVDELNSGA